MSTTSYNPRTANDVQPTLLVYDWSFFGQDQKRWPIPSPLLLIAFFVLGIVMPRLFGSLGISALFILAAIFPSRYLRRFMKKGDVINLLSVITCAMMVGNFDAIGDLMGSESFRFSWVLLGMAALLLPFQFNRLKNNAIFCVMIMGFVIAFQILSAIGKTSVFRAIEINGSYMAAFLILLAAMIKRETRDALACQLALVGMVNCGFCLFEMLFPSAVVSISSSQVSGEVIRSAGIYANAIASGLMVSAMLLFVTLSQHQEFCHAERKAGNGNAHRAYRHRRRRHVLPSRGVGIFSGGHAGCVPIGEQSSQQTDGIPADRVRCHSHFIRRDRRIPFGQGRPLDGCDKPV